MTRFKKVDPSKFNDELKDMYSWSNVAERTEKVKARMQKVNEKLTAALLLWSDLRSNIPNPSLPADRALPSVLWVWTLRGQDFLHGDRPGLSVLDVS